MLRKRTLLLLSIAMLGCSAGLVLVWSEIAPPTEPQAALHKAQQQWEAQDIDHYRLSLLLRGSEPPCTHTVEVRAEQVVAVVASSCDEPLTDPMTVTGLFKNVDHFVAGRYWINGFGCDCLVPEVVYDPQWGLPRDFRATMQDAPSIYRVWSRGCTAVAMFVPGWQLQAFEPLP